MSISNPREIKNDIMIEIEREKYILDQPVGQDILDKTIERMKGYWYKKGSVIILDISKINESWKRADSYLGAFEDRYPNDQLKYIESRKDLLNSKIDIPPLIALYSHVIFIDGKTRFCQFRDLGYKEMPFAIKEYGINVNKYVNFRAEYSLWFDKLVDCDSIQKKRKTKQKAS